ncbi:MAG TPA: hypothetical protein DCL80_12945 [Balneola sp.]|nr:hypothetical protein [Balneola sp.]MAO77244.1 hypothetical protein [Balneola sp.]HAH52101.1 hypothetical protein [Balneola sp.]HBZ39204.1 hypothetical protein [Balneola sp.]
MKKLILLLILLVVPFSAQAQVPFERAETDAGIIGLSITNFGTLGKPDVRNNPESGSSMRFPKSTGTEHLFEAGIWIGADVGGQIRLSSSSVTNPSGYARGARGFEFTSETIITRRSTDPNNEFFSVSAISEKDILTAFTDRRRSVNGTEIQGHDNPLYTDVKLESYNWGFPFTENFTILKYDITNNSDLHALPETWDSVYVGMYADLVVRNVNSATETGGAFFNKNGVGFMDSLNTMYAFDAGSPDDPSINTYGAVSIIGAEYRNSFFHPDNPDTLDGKFTETGFNVPDLGPSYWLFSAGAGAFTAPANDNDRYDRMAQQFPYKDNEQNLREDGQSGNGNYISFISMGPFPQVEPGETITVYFVFSAALKPDQFQGQPGKSVDNEDSRVNMVSTINSANSVFRGEDKNKNGVLDPGEDTDGNGELTRYLFPTPPDNPKTKIVLEAGKVSIYWDKTAEESVDRVSGEMDFEGYRVYSSDLGQDINPNSRLIREFDKPNNNIGFDVGFNEVELNEPVTFEGDTVEYYYKYDLSNLLSGWQYQVSVTAFDRGDAEFGVESLETSTNANAVRVFPGTPTNTNFGDDGFEVGVYPNPYKVNAAWDGPNEGDRKLYFYNLPSKAEIRIYTIAGDIIAELEHDSETYSGDISWFDDFSDDPRVLPGGEHAWDLQSEANQILTTGLYLFTVKDLNTGQIEKGKLTIIK